MKKFRKKPVEIEAVQITKDNIYTVQDQVNETLPGVKMIKLSYPAGGIHADGMLIPTLEGKMKCSLGDYLIRGVKGELYPCKPDIFELTYEPVQ